MENKTHIQCAWCGKWNWAETGEDEDFNPGAPYFREGILHNISHGICIECDAKMNEELEASK